jgi:hypothetical protein
MELGQYQLQVFVSLVVILGAAFVALICDFLKGNNEQLRELTVELKVRREEERKRSHTLTPRVATALAAAPVPAAATPMAAPKERVAIREKKRTVNAEAMAAMERGAALAGSGKRPRSTPKEETKPEMVIVSQQEASKSAANIKKDWGTLLSKNAQKPLAPAASHDLLAAVVAATNNTSESGERALPAGFQDGFVLNQLVQSRQPVSGLVVSIGVNAAHQSDNSVSKLIESLLGPNDFAAQSSEDEYLLIFPQERGASAQRRLSQIAQQLWDFQLRSLGSFQILFSWGGIEVRSESIEEAIASASERMQETKRGRKLLTMESPNALRQAV